MNTALAPRLWDSMWARLANPWTVVTRVALFFALLAALWVHSWPAIVLLTVAVLTNPWWFPPAPDAHGPLARAVAGARRWTRETHPILQAPLYVVGGLMFAVLVWAAWTQQLGLTVGLVVGFAVLKVGFFVQVMETEPPREQVT